MSESPNPPLAVVCDCEPAEALAARLSVASVQCLDELAPNTYVLRYDASGLGIELAGVKQVQRLVLDFSDPSWQQRRQRGGEMLVKALGGGAARQTVWDLTAGWGRDAWVLAMHGYRVHMIERNPIVVALLDDALSRAEQVGGEVADTAQRLSLRCDLAESVLAAASAPVPLIYMDPMFETKVAKKAKKQALSSKDLQWLQRLNAQQAALADPPEALLASALYIAEYRVVVKRAAKAPVLLAERRSHHLSGKSHRFDVYGLKKLP